MNAESFVSASTVDSQSSCEVSHSSRNHHVPQEEFLCADVMHHLGHNKTLLEQRRKAFEVFNTNVYHSYNQYT